MSSRTSSVAVQRVAVGERELGALGDHVHELGFREVGEVVSPEEGELLEGSRPGSPRSRLADREPVVVERGRRLEGRLPGCEVSSCEQSSLGSGKAIDLLGDEPLVEGEPRSLDLLFARPAAALLDDAAVGRRESAIAEESANLGSRQVEIPGTGPGREQLFGAVDRHAHSPNERKAVLRISDCELEDVPETPGSELAEEQEPGTEGAGDAGCQDAGAGNELVSELVEALDRRGRGRDSLPAEHAHLVSLDGVEDRGHLAARPVQVGLDDLQDESRWRRPRRTRSPPARAPTSLPATPASGSMRPSRRCRGARGE